MEDDDEIQSHPSPVTIAAAPPLTLALPIQSHPSAAVGASTSGSGDCWSEGATAVLIEAWGERYTELKRGNLKQNHWKEVAEIVNSRANYSKSSKSDVQCKNRIDTVKKKYKIEKAKIAAGGPPSRWRFFDRLERLIGAGVNVPVGIPVGVRPQLQQFQQRFNLYSNPNPNPNPNPNFSTNGRKRAAADTGVESESDPDDRSPGSTGKRGKWGESVRALTRAIVKLGEAYEEAESVKVEQMVEMEKERMRFAKELELQRMKFLMKTQLELSQLNKNHNPNHNNHGARSGGE